MDIEGPPLPLLTRRLADAPADFLAAPRIGAAGVVHVDAVARDVLASRGIEVPIGALAALASPASPREQPGLALLMCWLLAMPQLQWPNDPRALLDLLLARTKELAAHLSAQQIVADDERREELVRLTLQGLGQRPAGEALAHARDRWLAVSTLERARLIHASRAAEERARAIREALARKAAEESADKWSRE